MKFDFRLHLLDYFHHQIEQRRLKESLQQQLILKEKQRKKGKKVKKEK
jgi:hypothetical protein